MLVQMSILRMGGIVSSWLKMYGCMSPEKNKRKTALKQIGSLLRLSPERHVVVAVDEGLFKYSKNNFPFPLLVIFFWTWRSWSQKLPGNTR